MANTVTTTFRGEDQLSGVTGKIGQSFDGLGQRISGAGTSAANSSGLFGKVGSALGNMAQIAGGIIAANVFEKLAGGVVSFAQEGLRAVGATQMLETRLNSLFASNLMYEKQINTTTQAVYKSAEAIAAEQAAMEGNLTKRDVLAAQIEEQKQRVWEMTNQWTEEGLATQTAKAKLADMERQLGQLDATIAKGTSSIEGMATVTSVDWVKSGKSLVQIQREAKQETENLRIGIENFAKTSPVPTERIQEVGAFAVQMGMGSERALEFTKGMTNLGLALGLPAGEIVFLANNLKQMGQTGKLTAIDMREMSRRGFDLAKVIGVEMGMSVEEFNKKAETSPEIFDELTDAIIRFTNNTFGDTVDTMSSSLPAMMSNLKDIVTFAARDFMMPIVEAATPIAKKALAKLQEIFSAENMAKVGSGMVQIFEGLTKLFSGDSFAIFDFIQGLSDLGFDTASIVAFANAFTTIQTAIASLQAAWESGGVGGLLTTLGEMLQSGWDTYVAPVLQGWIDAATKWIIDTIPTIPDKLNQLLTSINTWLAEGAPQIQTSVAGWVEAFWGWVDTAITGVGAALGVLLVAIGAWATSGEAQTKLNEFGQNLGKLLADGIVLLFENAGNIATVLGKVVAGLAAGVAGVMGLLAVTGGQIAAGLIAGILEKLGIDVQPALFSELSGIFSGMWENLKTIAATLGAPIIQGFNEGITNGITEIVNGIANLALAVITAVKQEFGIASPSAVFADIGANLILGLVEGITNNIGSAISAVGSIFSSLFGGGGGEEGGFSFDFTTLITDLTVNIPAGITAVQTFFTTLLTTATELLNTFLTGPLFNFGLMLTALYEATIPTLQVTWQVMSEAAIVSTNAVITVVTTLDNLLKQVQSTFTTMATTVISKNKDVGSSFKGVADRIESDLIPAIRKATQEYEKMAAAAERAARAGRDAGSGGGGTGGGRAAGGPIFPGISYLVGEEGPEIITPTRQAYVNPNPGPGQQGGDTYNLNIYNPTGPVDDMVQNFGLLRALRGGA